MTSPFKTDDEEIMLSDSYSDSDYVYDNGCGPYPNMDSESGSDYDGKDENDLHCLNIYDEMTTIDEGVIMLNNRKKTLRDNMKLMRNDYSRWKSQLADNECILELNKIHKMFTETQTELKEVKEHILIETKNWRKLMKEINQLKTRKNQVL